MQGSRRLFRGRHRQVSSRVRILKVVQAYYPFQEQGGPVYKVRALARELGGRGHDVTVLTVDLGLSRYNGSLGKIQDSPWGAELREQNVRAIYLPVLANSNLYERGTAIQAEQQNGSYVVQRGSGSYEFEVK